MKLIFQMLIKAVTKFGRKDWNKIAEVVVGRTDSQCRERWCTVLDAGLKKCEWSEEEDALLKQNVSVFGVGQWAKICKNLPGRTPAMCKIRFRSFNSKRSGRKVIIFCWDKFK